MTSLLTTVEAAAELKISVKTLRGHVKAGAIRYIMVGLGQKRPRIAFDPSDIQEFMSERKRRSAPCQSTGRKAIRSTTSTSRSEVIGFLARREKAIAERQNKSRG